MTVTDLSAWSQVVASFAVLLTLVYLTIQVRQNSDLTRAASRQAMMGHAQQEILGFIDHPEIILAMVQEDEPSPEAKVRLWGWLNAALRAREHEWLQFRAGVLDEDSWSAYKQVIPVIMLGTPRARRWWAAFGAGQFHPEFCALVEKLLAEHPDPKLMARVLEIT